MAAVLAPAAQAGWGRGVRLDSPQSLDIVPALVGFSPGGEAAVGFGVQNADDPAVSRAFVALRSRSGAVERARLIPRARQQLAVGFDGSRLALLTGNAPPKRACCGSVALILSSDGRKFNDRTMLVGKLTGDTQARLLALPGGGLLAAIATQRGVWVSQTHSPGGAHAARRIASDGAPQTLGVAPLASGGAAVAWSTALGDGETQPRRIEVAFGSPAAAPHDPHVVVTVPAGHSVDELAVAPGSPEPKLAWIESWVDGDGVFHSQVETASASRGARGRPVSPADELASDPSFAAAASGRQALAWEGCDSSGLCSVSAAFRRHSSGRFGRPQQLGPADPTDAPSAAVAPDGRALVGWIENGDVVAATRGAGGGRFGRPQRVSASGLASGLTVGFGPSGLGLAVWTEGTLAPSVLAAPYRGS